MSDVLQELKKSLEATITTAIDRLDETDKHKLAESIKRSAVHASVGNTAMLKVEANTVALILWTDANERGKQARRDLIQAVAGALVKGLIAPL